MEAAKFNNLCSHYKDTFDNHRASIKQRDMLFYSLLIILAVFTLQLSSTTVVANIINEYVSKTTGIKLGNNIDFISTLLWFLLLGFAIRYFQVVVEIERQYGYIHTLEEQLNGFYPKSKAFTREGKSYLNKYPLFSNWVWVLYTIMFPIIIIFCVLMKIIAQITKMESIGANQIIDLICCFFIVTSSILYMYKLHDGCIKKFISYFRR